MEDLETHYNNPHRASHCSHDDYPSYVLGHHRQESSF